MPNTYIYIQNLPLSGAECYLLPFLVSSGNHLLKLQNQKLYLRVLLGHLHLEIYKVMWVKQSVMYNVESGNEAYATNSMQTVLLYNENSFWRWRNLILLLTFLKTLVTIHFSVMLFLFVFIAHVIVCYR